MYTYQSYLRFFGISQMVFRSVPSTKTEVKPSHEGNFSVNNNHLLMVCPPEFRAVFAELQ